MAEVGLRLQAGSLHVGALDLAQTAQLLPPQYLGSCDLEAGNVGLAFGQGVELDETFGELVRARLAERFARPVEVVNMGVDAYGTVQEAASLISRGLLYEPDCVAVLFISNDMELPAFLLAAPRSTDLSRSFALLFLRGWFGRLRDGRSLDAFSHHALAEPGRAPTAYRPLVGEVAYRRALAEMADALAPSAKRLVQLADYSTRHERRWRSLVQYQRELGIVVPRFELPAGRALWLSEGNRHLNPAGHRELADRVLAAFESNGVCLPAVEGQAVKRQRRVDAVGQVAMERVVAQPHELPDRHS